MKPVGCAVRSPGPPGPSRRPVPGPRASARPAAGRDPESGLALITVVALLAVMSIMAIAFILAIRNEEQAVRNYSHFALVKDVSDAGARVAAAHIREQYRGPDGLPFTGDEKLPVDTLEDPWAGGFADVLNRAEGLRMVYNARRLIYTTDPMTTFMGAMPGNPYAGINRPFSLGVDEDPPGDRDGLRDRSGDYQPGLPGVDDDGDGGIDRQDPEVRIAIANDPTYIPEYDDDEDGMMDEDGFDAGVNISFVPGLGIDLDGDRVGVFDEGSKLHLNYSGNIVGLGGSFPHVYNDGVTTFEINPAMLYFDRLLRGPGLEDPDGALIYSQSDAAALAAQVVTYLYAGAVPGRSPLPGAPGTDDNGNHGADLLSIGTVESPHMGNEGNLVDDNLDGVIDDAREYPLAVDGIDNDGDGETDEPDEGVDEPAEFTTRPPDLLRVRPDPSLYSDDRPLETSEAVKLAAPDLSRSLTLRLSDVPGAPPALRDELSIRKLTPYDLIKDYVTVYSSAPQQIVGRGYARDRINPNTTSNLVPLASRQGVESLFPAAIDNDGDWDPLLDDHNGNGIPDGDWDGLAEIGRVNPDGSPGPAVDGIDNDRDGLTDNPPVVLDGGLYDDGDINRDGIADYDPEWHVDEDGPGDMNGDGMPGIGYEIIVDGVPTVNPFLLLAGLSDSEIRELADDDGDGYYDLNDLEVQNAMERPHEDGIDNNWNSPVWLYDGVDNDGDGLTDERAYEDGEGKDEGVDEPGEWYIPAFDDDEDGRMDEDPPEFQFFLNLADAIDRPIPAPGDMNLIPAERLAVPQAPDPPQAARPVPRYSLFQVRDPLLSTTLSARTSGAGGNLEILQAIREQLVSGDPFDSDTFAGKYRLEPKVAYRGGEAIRINEVMVPFIRIWHDDRSDVIELLVDTETDRLDDIYPTAPSTPLECRSFPPSCDGTWPALDDYWHLYEGEDDDPLLDTFWIVHNYPDLPFGVLPPGCEVSRGEAAETLSISVAGVPEGTYEACYIPFPLEIRDNLAALTVLEPCSSWRGLKTESGVGAGEIVVTDSRGARPPVLLEADPIGAGPGRIYRVIQLPPIVVGSSHDFTLDVVIYPWALGTFGFTCLELYDPDQQYVEVVNLAKGERPVVLNGLEDDPERAWSLRVERPDLREATDIMLQGVVYSNPNPFDAESRAANLSLITRTGDTRAPLAAVHSVLRANYGLDTAGFPDQPDDLDSIPPMDTDVGPVQNLFLTSSAPADDATADLDIFRSKDLFSRSDGSSGLVMGGRGEAKLSLMALEDPRDALSRRFVVDQVRVVADTRSPQYRGFQSSERGDPFAGAYEFGTYTAATAADQNRLSQIRPFTRLYARDALAVSGRDLSSPSVGADSWVHPGAPWDFTSDAAEASGGYFLAPECTSDDGYTTGTWRWILDGNLDPSTRWVNVRVFGKDTVRNDRHSFGHIGWVRAAVYDLDTETDIDSAEAYDLMSGDVIASHLEVNPPGSTGRKVLEIEITNALRDAEDYVSLVCADELVPEATCTFTYVELSTAGTMAVFDPSGIVDDDRPLLGGTAGRPNGTWAYTPDAPEHWDGMMPNTGRVAFISTGMPYRPLTLDETARLVPMLTAHHEPDVPGLININTAPRPVLLCLPWAQPAAQGIMDRSTFDRMLSFANLMCLTVTNARQEFGHPPGGTRAPGVDDDQDGFLDEGPFMSTGDLVPAIRALRWTLGATPPGDSIFDWTGFAPGPTGGNLLVDEFMALFDDTALTEGDIGPGWMNRLEKEILARVSNLVTVQSNVYEIATRGRVVTDDGQVMAEAFSGQVLDRRF